MSAIRLTGTGLHHHGRGGQIVDMGPTQDWMMLFHEDMLSLWARTDPHWTPITHGMVLVWEGVVGESEPYWGDLIRKVYHTAKA